MSTPTFAKTHNLIVYLAKPTESEGFEQIIDFLNGSSISYALTASPTIRTSCIKQFWTTVKVKTINDEVRIQALIDEKRVNINESSIRHTLKLDDAEGTSCFANAEIFDVKNIKAGVPFFMFPRFVQLFIDHQLVDMSHHKDIYDNPFLTNKVFANMKWVVTGFSRVVTSLFDTMLVPAAEEVGLNQDDVQSTTIPIKPSTSKPHKKHKSKKQQPQALKVPSLKPSPKHRLPSPSNDPLLGGEDSLKLKELMDLCTHLSNKVLELESEVIDILSTYKDQIEKLEGRVDRLEEENRNLKDLHSVHSKVDIAAPVVEKEKSFKQGRIIAKINEDVEINLEEAQAKLYNIDLEHPGKVLSMQDVNDEELAKVKEVLKVVKAAKLMTEVVTTAGATTTAEATKVQSKDKGKGILIEEPKSLKGQAHIKQDEAFVRQLEAKLNTDINWNYVMKQVKKNESEIRPLFEKHYNYNQAFLEEVNEDVTIPENKDEVEGYKREGKSLEKEVTKKQKMDKEAEDLKSHLQIVDNDDDDRRSRESLEACQRKRYPLIHFTLEKMMNNVRLEVEEVDVATGRLPGESGFNGMHVTARKKEIRGNGWKRVQRESIAVVAEIRIMRSSSLPALVKAYVTHEHFDNGPIYPPFTNICKPYAHIAAKVAAKVQVKHKVKSSFSNGREIEFLD
nr:NADP-dependent malic enzyme [Tanacetum cinerariifolium]